MRNDFGEWYVEYMADLQLHDRAALCAHAQSINPDGTDPVADLHAALLNALELLPWRETPPAFPLAAMGLELDHESVEETSDGYIWRLLRDRDAAAGFPPSAAPTWTYRAGLRITDTAELLEHAQRVNRGLFGDDDLDLTVSEAVSMALALTPRVGTHPLAPCALHEIGVALNDDRCVVTRA